MDIQKVLQEYKQRFDGELALYLDQVIDEAREKDTFVAEALEYVKTFSLSGGKRLRSTLMYFGYLAAGGKEKDKIAHAALSIELIHIFLLIHDDIIDRDVLRHGVATLHTHYAKRGQQLFITDDHQHFGESMALIMGDMVYALGNRTLFESSFAPELILKALIKMQEIVSMTVIGQTKDVYIEYAKSATEEEIIRMYEYKTARYTVEGPLQLGALLGGASEKLLQTLSQYAIPLGIAFQIQDDILGIFGSEKKLGKPVNSDIQEGKWTILVSQTMKRLDTKEGAEFMELLRKGSSLTKQDAERFRELVHQSGALEYAKKFALEAIQKGKQALLADATVEGEAREFLLGVADFMMQREC
jgi:geranylgeranyl diphosphate synthase type I